MGGVDWTTETEEEWTELLEWTIGGIRTGLLENWNGLEYWKYNST